MLALGKANPSVMSRFQYHEKNPVPEKNILTSVKNAWPSKRVTMETAMGCDQNNLRQIRSAAVIC